MGNKLNWEKNNLLTNRINLFSFVFMINILLFTALFYMYDDFTLVYAIIISFPMYIFVYILFSYVYPDQYAITNKGIYLRYRKSIKVIYWNDIKEFERSSPHPFVMPKWTIVAKDSKKHPIESILTMQVVEKIMNEFDVYKNKNK